MPWGVAAAAVGAAGVIGGGMMQSSATGKAAAQSAQVQREMAEMQRLENNRAREDLQQWRESGNRANIMLGDLAGNYGPEAAQHRWDDAMRSPGYEWRYNEGLRGIDAGAAAKGMLRSGAQLKAEQAYGQGLASQEFENYYNRLFNLSAQGLGAATNQANASLATGSGQLQTGRGLAATDTLAGQQQANIYGNMAQGLTTQANALFSDSKFQGMFGGVGSGNPNLVWNPNNAIGTSSLGGATANNGWISNALSYGAGG